MANQPVRTPGSAKGGRSTRQRAVAAAARAAAKRAERAHSRMPEAERADAEAEAPPVRARARVRERERDQDDTKAGFAKARTIERSPKSEPDVEPDVETEAEAGDEAEQEPEPKTAGTKTDNAKAAGTNADGSKADAGRARGAAETEEDAEKDSVQAGARPLLKRPALLSAALAVLVVAGLVACVLLALDYRDARRTDEARKQAPAAARKAAPVVLSYDYRRLDRDFAAARAHLTGDFLDRYRKTTATVVAPAAKKYRGVVKATIAEPQSGDTPAVSVVAASPDEAVVLLFVNQVTESTEVSGPRVDLNRVRMTLTRTPGGWKVSAVDAL